MSSALIIFIIVLVIIVILVAIGFSQFNKLRRLDVQVDGAYAGIDTLLTKRADLVPNLVETVKGAADFEKGTMENVTAARASMAQAQTIEQKATADGALTQALGRLFAVAEAYPQLTATQGFQDLQGQLQQIEGELQFARQYYNDAVVQLNTATKTAPAMWFTGIAKVTERPMYAEADTAKREAPKVQF